MKRYSTYRYVLMISIFLLISGLSACNGGLSRPVSTETGRDSDSSDENSSFENLGADMEELPSGSQITVTTTPTPSLSFSSSEPSSITQKDTLKVRGSAISLGESKSSLIEKFGHPNRIDETEYDYEYYVYNNDYSRLLYVAVKKSEIVGFYTDSLDFDYQGITSGSSMDSVSNILGQTFSMEEVLIKETDKYTIRVLMDKLGTGKVTGIYVLDNNLKEVGFTDTVIKNIELMVYDLTNSIRIRNHESILSWSSSVALAARKHSDDMAKNHFFHHINPKGEKPGERLTSEGIYYKNCGENIIAGYGTAILSTHGWFNSSGHRKNLLKSEFRYLGVGFTYLSKSRYHTYITQDFYW